MARDQRRGKWMLGVVVGAAVAMATGCTQVSASADGDMSASDVGQNEPDVGIASSAAGSRAGSSRPSATKSEPVAPLVGPARTLTITGSGDILIHPSLADQADSNGGASNPNFAPMLADLKSRISAADYSICHAETPFSPPGYRQPFPHYYVHPNLAKGAKATGFDDCSIASNWTFDKGLSGVRRTISALDDAGLNYAGANPNKNAERITVREVSGVKVAHLSYTDPGDSPAVPGAEWAVNRQDPEQIAADASQARNQGAEVVIVSLAMGEMGAVDLSASQKQAANTITANGDVDYVIGHGSHTVQPAQKFNGTWVVWHGNLMSSFFPDQTRMLTGLVSAVTFTEQPGGRFAVTSLKGYPVQSVKGGAIRSYDIVEHGCSGAQQYGTQWNMIVETEAKAIQQGMVFPKPCK
jgi:poly-gamma-glutamate capsule biosynthesis protein CapA/YwtB (metallophosphatase superfamily)